MQIILILNKNLIESISNILSISFFDFVVKNYNIHFSIRGGMVGQEGKISFSDVMY